VSASRRLDTYSKRFATTLLRVPSDCCHTAVALPFASTAYRERSNHVTHLKVDSYFDSVRGEARFQQLMQRMRLTDDQLSTAGLAFSAAVSEGSVPRS
jgi:hypothetical protein